MTSLTAAMRAAWRAWLACLLLALSACATPPASAPQDNFWSGRLALSIASEPPQSVGAAFELRGNVDEGELTLLSPLGQTVALARWSAVGAALLQGEHSASYPSMDELTEHLTGAVLPMAALFQWLHGREAIAPGWLADLSEHANGRIQAERLSPLPKVELRIRLQP